MNVSRQLFPPSHRLRKAFEYQTVKKFGIKYKTDAFWAQLYIGDSTKPSKLGIIATKKLGTAVKRNQAKRILREIFRKNLSTIPQHLQIIILPKITIFSFSYSDLESSLLSVVDKFNQRQ